MKVYFIQFLLKCMSGVAALIGYVCKVVMREAMPLSVCKTEMCM